MKKTFYPISFASIVFSSIAFFITAIGLLFLFQSKDIAIFIVCILSAALLFFTFFTKCSFDENSINVPSDFSLTNNKIQYEMNVLYKDILEINLIYSKTDSEGNIPKSIKPQLTLGTPFIEILCKDGTIKMIWVKKYSKNQVKQIIKEITKRCDAKILCDINKI